MVCSCRSQPRTRTIPITSGTEGGQGPPYAGLWNKRPGRGGFNPSSEPFKAAGDSGRQDIEEHRALPTRVWLQSFEMTQINHKGTVDTTVSGFRTAGARSVFLVSLFSARSSNPVVAGPEGPAYDLHRRSRMFLKTAGGSFSARPREASFHDYQGMVSPS